jgi:carbonic anhydrase
VDKIIAGVRAFQRDVYPQYRELFEQLAAGQSPVAMVITCSDSRVDPFLFTQAQPGQLFVLRNAGNIVPKYGEFVGGVTATIEFAVVGLRVPNIIVCGHSGCGAMTGLLRPGQLKNMPSVSDWLRHAVEVRDGLVATGGLDQPEVLQRAVEANVVVQLGHLRTHPCVVNALEAGRIQLHGWIYDFVTGMVQAYNPQTQQFAPLAD